MNLYEVVFEDVSATSAIQLVVSLISMSKAVLNVDSTYGMSELDEQHVNSSNLQALLSIRGDGCISLRLLDFNTGDVVLPGILLRCIKYGGQFDVDFSFAIDEDKSVDVDYLMRHVHCFVQKIAKVENVENFYGGMEPASDEETRYFTNQTIGPLGAR